MTLTVKAPPYEVLVFLRRRVPRGEKLETSTERFTSTERDRLIDQRN
jgi:hypothetical protein